MDEKTSPPEEPSLPPEAGLEVVTYESEPPTNTAATMPRPTDAATVVKKVPKKWLIWLIGVVIFFVGVGGVLAYNLWYQNPQKVITDSLVRAVAAKTVSYSATFNAISDSTATITIDGGLADSQQSGNATLSFTSAGKSYVVKGAVVIDKASNVYFKLTNVADLVKPYRAALPSSGQVLLDDLTTKLGGSWIKLSPTDLKNYNGDLATAQQCMATTVSTLEGNKAASRELATVYKNHQFITIDKKLAAKQGSLGYEISINPGVVKAFDHDFQTTTVYKALHKCNSQVSLSSFTGLFSGDSGKTTVYVSRYTHQLTSLSVASKDSKAKTSATFTLVPLFNVPVTVQVPTKTTTVSQLLHDLQDVLQSATKPSL